MGNELTCPNSEDYYKCKPYWCCIREGHKGPHQVPAVQPITQGSMETTPQNVPRALLETMAPDIFLDKSGCVYYVVLMMLFVAVLVVAGLSYMRLRKIEQDVRAAKAACERGRENKAVSKVIEMDEKGEGLV